MSPARVCEVFNIPMRTEVEVMPAVYQSTAGPLQPLVEMISNCLRQTGEVLAKLGASSFADFFRASLAAEEGGGPPSAAAAVSKLVATFPAFRDECDAHVRGEARRVRRAVLTRVVQGVRVCLYKKAQILVSELYMRLKVCVCLGVCACVCACSDRQSVCRRRSLACLRTRTWTG